MEKVRRRRHAEARKTSENEKKELEYKSCESRSDQLYYRCLFLEESAATKHDGSRRHLMFSPEVLRSVEAVRIHVVNVEFSDDGGRLLHLKFDSFRHLFFTHIRRHMERYCFVQ